jgi:hypothetical protein
MKFKPMTPEQVTRSVCMRRYAWGKRVQQLADESGVPARTLHDVIVGKPFSEAVRSRLERYLCTPAGPAALRQDNNRTRNPDSPRFLLLRRIFRVRSLAQQFTGPTAQRDSDQQGNLVGIVDLRYGVDAGEKAGSSHQGQ